jgi:hypothetical protein
MCPQSVGADDDRTRRLVGFEERLCLTGGEEIHELVCKELGVSCFITLARPSLIAIEKNKNYNVGKLLCGALYRFGHREDIP